MTAALRVVAPGLMTTLQDLGRPGYQHLGVPVSGALDPVSLRAANLLVGNAPGMGALEIAYQGPTLAVEADSVRIAAGRRPGGDRHHRSRRRGGGSALPPSRARACTRGQTLQDRRARRAAPSSISRSRAASPSRRCMGSQSTLTRGGIGGFEGRALQAGDMLPLRQAAAAEREEVMLPAARSCAPAPRARGAGPAGRSLHAGRPAPRCSRAPTPISRASDRMGMRLEGPDARAFGQGLQHRLRRHRPGLHPGAGQRPAHRAAGRPADHRRLPQDRHRHLRRPARAWPHDAWREDRLRRRRHRDGRGRRPCARRWRSRTCPRAWRRLPRKHAIDVDKLLGENLISGAVDARADPRSEP